MRLALRALGEKLSIGRIATAVVLYTDIVGVTEVFVASPQVPRHGAGPGFAVPPQPTKSR